MERPDTTNDDGRHDGDNPDAASVETIDKDTARDISDDDDLPA